MNKSPQYNQQSKSEVEEICIYQNMEETGCHNIYISENKQWVPSRKNPEQQSRSVILHSAKSAFMFTTMQPR